MPGVKETKREQPGLPAIPTTTVKVLMPEVKKPKEKNNIHINLNQMAKVKLTQGGIKHLNDIYKKLGIKGFQPNVTEEGYYQAPIWSLMNDFGELMTMGNTELPFETMNIEVIS